MMKRILAATAVLAIGVAAGAAAQSHPQTRQGFWIGFGLGGGQASVDCGQGACTGVDPATGGSGYLRLGGRLNNRWLLGGESNSWVGEIEDAAGDPSDVVAGFLTATAYFYPNPASGLFIKGGLGFYSFTAQDTNGDEATSSAPAIVLGVGYDIRVGRMISITPVLTIVQSGAGDLEFNSVATGVDDFKSRLIALQVGVTFH